MLRETLLIIDGFNVIRRVFGANPAPDGLEKAQAAMKASHSSLRRALREHSPTYCVLAMDPVGKNWRHTLYDGYKAARAPMPDDLRNEVDTYLASPHRAVKGVLCVPGVEADDVIGALTIQAMEQSINVVVLSTDKDLTRLLLYGASIYNHFDSKWHDDAWCRAKFGVGPEMMLDWLALTGDPTDGIPGVSKIGAKTATKLLLEYGSLDAILAAAPQLNGVVGKNLIEQADIAKLSRSLVELKLDLFVDGFDFSPYRV